MRGRPGGHGRPASSAEVTSDKGLIVELGAKGQVGADRSARWESAVFAGLCVAGVLPTLVMAPWLSDSFELPKAVGLWIIAAYLLVALTGLFLWRGNALSGGHRPSGRFVEWALLGFLAVTGILATAMSVDPVVSLLGNYGRHGGLLTLLSGLLVAGAALQVEWTRRRLRTLLTTVCAALVLCALYGIAQSVGVDPFFRAGAFTQGRAGGTFGNPSLVSGVAALGLPLALGLLGRLWGNGAIARVLGVLVLMLLSAFLVLTLSRGAWIAAAIGSTLWVALAVRTRIVSRGAIVTAVVATAMVVAVVTGLSALATSQGPSIVERAASAIDMQDSSIAIRVETWRTAQAALVVRPVLGWGPDAFGLVSIGFETPRLTRLIGDVVEDNAHSFPLQIALDQGVPAALALVGLMVLLIARSARVLSRSEVGSSSVDQRELRAVADALLRRRADVRGSTVLDPDEIDVHLEKEVGLALALGDVPSERGERTANVLTLLCAVSAYFIAVSTTVSPVGSVGLFWLLLGILAALVSPSFAEDRLRLPLGARIPQQARIAALALSCVSLAAISVVGALMLVGDLAFNRGSAAEARSSMTESRIAYADAMRLVPWEGRYSRSYGRALIIAGLQISDAKMKSEAIRVFEEGRTAHPHDLAGHLFAAQAYMAIGHAEREPQTLMLAVQRLEHALRLRPNSLEVRDLLATVYYDLDQEDDALRVATESLRLRPNPRAYYHLGRLAQSRGDSSRAAEYYRKTLRMDPTAEDAADALEALTLENR